MNPSQVLIQFCKNRIYLFLFLLLQLPTFCLFGQHAEISGTLKDSDDQPLAYANLLLKAAADSTLAKVGISDDDGYFQLVGLEPGDYFLEVSYVGLSPLYQSVSLKDTEQLELGAIKMADESAVDIGEVTVTARRPLIELKNDRMIFNVENSVNAAGNNGLDLLRKSPGVLVDNNNNISLLGRPGVRIFINGRPSPLRGEDLSTYMQSLQSIDIDAIEIITNPGSKYEAEGNAGIINIKLRKDASLGANATVNMGYSIGIFPRYNAGISGNYRNKLMNIYGSFSGNENYSTNTLSIEREQFNFAGTQSTTRRGHQQPGNFKLGADFFLSEKSTLGLLVEGGFNNYFNRGTTRSILKDRSSGLIDSILLAENNVDGTRNNQNYNLNYEWKISKGATLSIDANYGAYRRDRENDQPNSYYDANETTVLSEFNYKILTNTEIDITALKIDYEGSLWKGKLGLGAKYTLIDTKNDFQFLNVFGEESFVDIDRTNNFNYEENVNALYINYSNKITKDINFQVGLRMEETNSTGTLEALKEVDNERIERTYLDWFPSASLNMKLNKNNQLQFSFSRRINRPAYNSLNPFEYRLDELTFSRGNPFLQPEYSNIFQIRHNYKFKINTTLSYSKTTDMMVFQAQAGEGNTTFRERRNLQTQNNYSINIAAPTPVTDWWNSLISVTGYYRENSGDFGGENVVDLKVTSYNLYTQQAFNLSKKITLELSGFYNAPTINEASAQSRAMYSIDTGMKIKMFDGDGTLSLALSDVFNTMEFRADMDLGPLELQARNKWESQRFLANFSYLFGNKKLKRARSRKTGLDDEKRRTSGE